MATEQATPLWQFAFNIYTKVNLIIFSKSLNNNSATQYVLTWRYWIPRNYHFYIEERSRFRK